MSRLVLNKSGQWIKSIPKLSHKSNFKIPIKIKTTTEELEETTTTTTSIPSIDPPSPIPSPPSPAPVSEPSNIVPIIPKPIETPPSTPTPPIPKIPILPAIKSIRGIQIPIKPPPPGSEECCMSGCAHCIYDIYLSTLQEHQLRIGYTRKALMGLKNPKIDITQWPVKELGEMNSEEHENDSIEVRAKKDLDLVMKDVDPSIRAFLEMEARLKKKKLDREKAEMDAMDALKKT